MDADKNKWKESVGFQINYRSDNSDDDDDVEVVMRNPRQTRPLRHSDRMLADEGDGSEADQLGTTPPRERIRLKRRGGVPERALSQHARPAALRDHPAPAHTPERTRRLNHKTERSRARDDKLGGEQAEPRADSLPSPDTRRSHVPTLVESCSRFMSLTSRLKKCRGAAEGERAGGGGGEGGEGAYARDLQPERRARGPPGAGGAGGEGGEFPPSRVSFYQTFSMLINMGNIDKGCRRMMSREEQVWQNELKDLIWLELQARIAGRSLAEQDAFLCAQRDYVPAVVSNIRNYRFVNTSPCCAGSPAPGAGAEPDELDGDEGGEGGGGAWWCASLECGGCARAVGKALRELGTLLDSYQRALQLYPSERAMTADHPLVATNLFKNRLKAMCLWYNTAMHLRLKVLAVRRMIRTMKLKSRRRHYRHAHLASTDSDISRQSWESPRACTVRFNVSDNNTPSSSSNSAGASHHSDDGAPPPATHEPPPATTPATHEPGEPADGRDQCDSTHQNDLSEQETSPEGAEPSTPEIVISDARYDTADTAASSESGYTSAGDTDSPPDDDVFDIGSLSDVTELRLLDRVPVSIYRSYHQEMLKTQGVRRCMTFINKMRNNLLHKVYLTLEKPDSCMVEEEPGSESEVFDDARDPGGAGAGPGAGDGAGDDEYELRRFGCWSEECRAMRLPSYRGHFLLLCTVCLEVVHDYLALRLEDRPDNPSALTVKQLIHELKEGLDIAADMRAAFARHVHTALAGRRPAPPHARALLLVLRTFDRTVDTVLEQYLSYLRTVSRVEQLPRGALQAEWAFTARLARRVACALRHAPTAFAEIACNQLDRVHKQLEQKFEQLKELDKRAGEPDKNFVYSICRAAQQVYAGERDATLHAAHWARSLAARLARDPAHIHRRAGIFNSLMSIRDLLVAQTMYILERSSADIDESDALGARVRELMLQIYRLGFELHKELYKFAQAPFQVSRERRRRPASLQPARRRAGDTPTPRRPETMIINQSFNPLIHKELHRFVHDSPRSPCARRSGAGAGGAGAGARLARSESVVEDGDTNVFEDTIIDNVNCFAEKQSSIELFLLGESARCLAQSEEAGVSGACEGQGEGERGEVEERRWAALVARAVVEFAHCWMTFVVERCETGRGLRPRWASQGLEFLMLACDPCNTSHLSEEEFEQLKHKMDACISHVIGARRAPGPAPAPPRAAPAPAPAPPDAPPDHKPHTPSTARRRLPRSPLPSAGRGAPPLSASPAPPAPPTPPTEPDPLFHFPGVDYSAHSARVSAAARRLDEARARRLGEARAVGRVLDAPVHTYEPKLRQLQFKWQRGLKIGAGSFGKVYTVVNTETGQLLAMKEIALGAGDRRALQRAANELRVLEGVIHPHLVRYYGCELHREEMLLFMELCVEGSLEALLATAGALQEHMVRRYTKQLLSAVCELHARGIAHRDIKSGNIFLTNEGHCLKLGDFGCAVKIRANTTAAGELKGHVGTQAYMAPEVFMKPTGHGRAADVWSLGCVVTEMASGKRPFSEYDSNVQIMFVVGMGGRPAVPDALSAEGRAFCLAALTHEPAQRPAANELQLHHFLMLKADDDCQCEPAFLIT